MSESRVKFEEMTDGGYKITYKGRHHDVHIFLTQQEMIDLMLQISGCDSVEKLSAQLDRVDTTD